MPPLPVQPAPSPMPGVTSVKKVTTVTTRTQVTAPVVVYSVMPSVIFTETKKRFTPVRNLLRSLGDL